MVDFIDGNRQEFGAGPICEVLPIAPSGYYAPKSRPSSARARRDVALILQLVALWRANYSVYGARKLWKAARRAGIDVGRDQAARLMRLAELGAAPSVGTVGDSYDNALAETVNGLYKTELIRGPTGGPWRSVGGVELATLAWVHWHNTQRLYGHLDDVPPPRSSRPPTLPTRPTVNRLETNKPSLQQTQGDSVPNPDGGWDVKRRAPNARRHAPEPRLRPNSEPRRP